MNEVEKVALRERLRRAFDADSVAEKNLAIRAAYDAIAALDEARGDPVAKVVAIPCKNCGFVLQSAD